MNILFIFLTVSLLFCLPLIAQDVPKAELFGGYSYMRIDDGGLILNINKLSVTAAREQTDTDEEITIGSHRYRWDQIEQVSGQIVFRRACPYLGVGLGNAVRKHRVVTFQLDAGVVFQGASTTTLFSPKQDAIPGLKEDLEAESRRLEAKANKFRFFPLLQIGVGYHF